MTSNDNNNRKREKHLFYLNELSDYKVSSDDPDVRGWQVKDVDNRVIGKVENLLVNKSTERVVYLDIEVDKSIMEANHDPYGSSASEGVHEFVNKDGEEHLIVPIGLVQLNEDEKFIYTEKVNHRTFAETKRIKKGSTIDRDYEKVVLASYDRATSAPSDRNKTSADKKAFTSDRYKDADREIEFNEDSNTKTREHQQKNPESTNISNKEAKTNVQDSKRVEKNEELASFDDKKTSFSSKKEGEAHPAKEKSKAGTTSEKVPDRKYDDEDFYNKQEFDDKNFRKKK